MEFDCAFESCARMKTLSGINREITCGLMLCVISVEYLINVYHRTVNVGYVFLLKILPVNF